MTRGALNCTPGPLHAYMNLLKTHTWLETSLAYLDVYGGDITAEIAVMCRFLTWTLFHNDI